MLKDLWNVVRLNQECHLGDPMREMGRERETGGGRDSLSAPYMNSFLPCLWGSEAAQDLLISQISCERRTGRNRRAFCSSSSVWPHTHTHTLNHTHTPTHTLKTAQHDQPNTRSKLSCVSLHPKQYNNKQTQPNRLSPVPILLLASLANMTLK